ncbi:MAG: hypothetical protein EOO16_23310 [Chitinophagaceae bacterium]|nr:MAG: hypothetical protein EOO16_23310 [Chitinophagaceae bacterium]
MRSIYLIATLCLAASCSSADKTTRDSSGDTGESNPSSGSLGKQPTIIEFKEGDAVDVLWAASYYPATIVSYDRSKNCYEVKYEDPAYPNACQEKDRLKPRGKSYAEPGSNNPEDAFGTWRTGTVTTTTTEDETYTTTEVHAYTHGTITINPDHTWQWDPISTEHLEGKWDVNPAPDKYKGPIHIINGMSGEDWFVGYYGKDDLGKPSIYVRNNIGQRWFGGR